MQRTVHTLQEDQITTNGEINWFKVIISLQAEKVKKLQQSALQVTQALKDIAKHSNEIIDNINAHNI